MDELVGCDFSCQRKQNMNRLQDTYDKELDVYFKNYGTYIEYKNATGPNKEWKRKIAKSKYLPLIVTSNNKLNKILSELKDGIKKTESMINEQTLNVQGQTDTIRAKNSKIDDQMDIINHRNKELVSKDRQLTFSTERNRYRRISLLVLVLVNILLVIGIIQLVK